MEQDLKRATSTTYRVAHSSIVETIVDAMYTFENMSDKLFDLYISQYCIDINNELNCVLAEIVKSQPLRLREIEQSSYKSCFGCSYIKRIFPSRIGSTIIGTEHDYVLFYDILHNGIILSNVEIRKYSMINYRVSYYQCIEISHDDSYEYPICIELRLPVKTKYKLNTDFGFQCKNALFWINFSSGRYEICFKDLDTNQIDKIVITEDLFVKECWCLHIRSYPHKIHYSHAYV
jgi:hypothetical protein